MIWLLWRVLAVAVLIGLVLLFRFYSTGEKVLKRKLDEVRKRRGDRYE